MLNNNQPTVLADVLLDIQQTRIVQLANLDGLQNCCATVIGNIEIYQAQALFKKRTFHNEANALKKYLSASQTNYQEAKNPEYYLKGLARLVSQIISTRNNITQSEKNESGAKTLQGLLNLLLKNIFIPQALQQVILENNLDEVNVTNEEFIIGNMTETLVEIGNGLLNSLAYPENMNTSENIIVSEETNSLLTQITHGIKLRQTTRNDNLPTGNSDSLLSQITNVRNNLRVTVQLLASK